MTQTLLTVLLIGLIIALIPVARLQRQKKLSWPLPTLFAAILFASAVRSWAKFGVGTPKAIALDLSLPLLCALIAALESLRSHRERH